MENLFTLLAPLYKLLRKGVAWRWGRPQRQAFDGAKELLSSPKLLVHYNATKELILTCDASPYGLGAVLTHRMEDGTERPIEYASRTLAPAERNYAQIDKEALSIMYRVKRFHKYLYGRPFVICSDHKPYLPIRRAQGNIGNCISSSAAVGSQSHGLPILHCPDKLANVDGLSRLPIPTAVPDPPKPIETVLLLDQLNASLVTAARVRSWTDRDPCLSKVWKLVMPGWTTEGEEKGQLQPFASRKWELSVEDGCLLWGTQVIVPPQLRSAVLDELHEGHPGIGRMKSFARSYVWWPGVRN